MDAPEGWQPPGVLCDFLENGAPLVSVGFGSMTSQDPERMTEAVVEVLGMSGRRGSSRPGGAASRTPTCPST